MKCKGCMPPCARHNNGNELIFRSSPLGKAGCFQTQLHHVSCACILPSLYLSGKYYNNIKRPALSPGCSKYEKLCKGMFLLQISTRPLNFFYHQLGQKSMIPLLIPKGDSFKGKSKQSSNLFTFPINSTVTLMLI